MDDPKVESVEETPAPEVVEPEAAPVEVVEPELAPEPVEETEPEPEAEEAGDEPEPEYVDETAVSRAAALARVKSVTWVGGGNAIVLFGQAFFEGQETEVSMEFLEHIATNNLMYGFQFNMRDEEELG